MRPFPAEFRSWATDEPQSHTQISLCRLAWDCPMRNRQWQCRGPRFEDLFLESILMIGPKIQIEHS
jgi:hypothetical protein